MEKKATIRSVSENPLKRLLNGESVADLPRPMKKLARIGNLYHEFVKGTSLQPKGVKGEHVAEILEAEGEMTVDRASDLYAWKGEPWSKQRFLDFVNRNVKIKNASGQ